MAAQDNVPLPQPIPLDEKLAAFDNVPLFMKSLPEDSSEDVALSALQALVHEGTPDENAQNFKEQGNEYFKGKRYREALGFYSQGVDAKPEDKILLEALLCNRAACNLELKNYGSVLRDCSKAISINAHSSKAYYRSALALVALERYDEALDCCDRCLQFDKDNKSIQGVREKAAKLKGEKERKERERQERIRQEQLEKERLRAAYRERNIIVNRVPDNVTSTPYEPHFDPEDSTNSSMIFPVLFMYPQYATTDLISHFHEDTPFSAHLSAMFPPNSPQPEWDKKGEYVDGNLVVFGWTKRRRLLKIGKKMTLRDVCKAAKAKDGEPVDGIEMNDGTLSFVVLPKGKEEQKWMSVQHKIFRTANAPRTAPDETETAVAQAIIDLENSAPELKGELRPLQISAAREVDVRGGKKAIVIFVPVPQLKAFHKVQQRLTRELEKKFSDRHVVFVAQRRMLRKPTRTSRVQQKRPRSRTLTSVHDKILEDLVFPTDIVGKRTRVAVDGSKLLKVFLDAKDATSLEYKLDSFSSVYRRLTGKDVVFEFPVQAQD
ncbi:40S ribosomal protein S7 [Lentinus tigrinus ALCF2SS1-7]|uniref:40S ribosomal protein S7 n=1 Tax=Lentinus tigrinus ALCF2SS1-6 TaxID=1328759 RepID=A0A5C2SW74_9APHY|nr:40S ribosomal protein S7 [Lentinus tigrinus ALCF2SS1-6]RPD81031.1 40S ribosomal protein S7 [Lentinus tigrinus ALCF2SS1-7]